MESWPVVSDVEETISKVKSYDGVEIHLHRFVKKRSTGSDTPTSTKAALPAVVYTYGGGYFCLGVPLYRKILQAYVTNSGVKLFAVEYRFPPEHPYPAPVEDCYAAFAWVSTNAAQLGVDPARLAIMGDSAGGGLAAGIAIIARDRKLSPPLAKQLLIGAMIDDQNQSHFEALEKLVTWSPDDNLTGWAAYLGQDKAGKAAADVAPYAAPSRLSNYAGLPPIFLDVPDLDIFRSENIEYVAKHVAANIPTELYVYPGPHSFEAFAPGIYNARAALGIRVKAIQSI